MMGVFIVSQKKYPDLFCPDKPYVMTRENVPMLQYGIYVAVEKTW